ncbi:MAG: peptidoglycan editing factor PgeF [Alloprevotella sp.]
MLLNYPVENPFCAFSTTRHGGVGEGAYATFNVTHYCGDEPAVVQENLRRLAVEIRLPEAHILLPRQVHGDRIEQVGVELLSEPPAVCRERLEGVDGLVTDLQDVCIGISTADCLPLLLYDVSRRALAAVHAGWRGTVQGIASKAVRRMEECYGCRPLDVRAVIGPCISREAFEVGEEVYEAFRAAGLPMREIAARYPAGYYGGHLPEHSDGEKWHIDLSAANVCQLLDAGIQLPNIRVSGICTYLRSDEFFSARRLGLHSGRIYTAIFCRSAC